MKKLIIIKFIIIFSLLSCGQNNSIDESNVFSKSDMKKYMSGYIKEQMEVNNLTGVSIAVVSNNKIIWAEGFGESNRKKGIPASEKTIYELGSISKLITGASIMQLKEKGLLDLDAPITDYIPEFSIKTKYEDNQPITIRMIMTHQSGLQRDKLENYHGENNETFHDLVGYLKDVYIPYPPGKKFSYSNVGIDLLAIIIERVTGETFFSYTKKNIFEPLDMKTASFVPLAKRDNLKPKVKSVGHSAWDKNSFVNNLCRDTPCGSLNASVLDMSRFMMMFLNKGSLGGKRILEQESIDEITTVQNIDNPLLFGYRLGLNLFLSRDNNISLMGPNYGHPGATQNYQSNMWMLHDQKIGVIASTNTDSGERSMYEIVNKALKLMYQIETGSVPPEKVVTYDKIQISESDKKAIIGDYTIMDQLVRITNSDNNLKANINNNDYDLVAYKDKWFSITGFDAYSDLLFKFEIVDDIFTVQAKFKTYGVTIFAGEKIESKSISDIWKKRIGLYRIVNPNEISYFGNKTIFRLDIEDGYLMFNKTILIPLNDIEAITPGRREISTIRFFEGDEVIDISGFQFIKI